MGKGYQHAAALFAFILSITILAGAVGVIIKTIITHRERRLEDGEENGSCEHGEAVGEKKRQGGARRLRRALVLSLLTSDGLIAMSSIGPAASVISGQPVTDKGCESPGFLLATSLWWQYGFSLTIAITTYVALCHPLSRFKVAAENRVGELVALVVLIGVAQAVLWQSLRGFQVWEDFCFYGPPSQLAAELLQFVPRLAVSLVIIAIYVRLVIFLNRPDLSSAYLPSPQIPQTPSSDPIPPWERMTIPDFSTALEGASDGTRGRPKSSGGVSVASLARVFGSRRPVSPGSAWLAGTELELKVEIHGVEPAILQSRANSQNTQTMLISSLPALQVDEDKCRLAPEELHLETEGRQWRRDQLELDEERLQLPLEQDSDHLSIAETLHTTRDDPEVSSFRGMLDYARTPSAALRRSPSVDALTRPSTPDEMQVESMASFMNRQMRSYLVWFPLMHLIICCLTIFRFVYCSTTGRDGPVMQALTLVMIMGQGIADIVIFGFVERRTQLAYRNEVAACSPAGPGAVRRKR